MSDDERMGDVGGDDYDEMENPDEIKCILPPRRSPVTDAEARI
jgi:hypothetical protein